MHAGSCRLFAIEVNTIYNCVPNGANLVVLFLDRPTSKLSLYFRDHYNAACCTQTQVESEIMWCLGTLHHRQSAMGGEKSPKCMKKHEAATVSMEQKKNSGEKCQQQIAAGFCCLRRHGLWFPHVSFLSRYASSFHPIKHKHRLESTTQEAS